MVGWTRLPHEHEPKHGVGVGMVDPRMLAAHQQAMVTAMRTYQLVVAGNARRGG